MVDVLRLGKAERDETLTVRNRDRRERKASIGVEPEEKRNPESEVLVRGLVGLVAVVYFSLNVRSDWSSSVAVLLKSGRGLSRDLLAHATLPGRELVLWDSELTVEYVRFARVRVDRVRVDLEADLVEDTLTRVLTVAVKNNVRSVSSGTSERSGRSANDNVGNHVSEEITVLRDRDRNIRVERNVVGRYFEILEGNGNVRLVVRVDEENVRALKVSKRRVSVGLTSSGTTSLDSRDVVAKKLVGQ